MTPSAGAPTARVVEPGDPGWPHLLDDLPSARAVERLWVLGRDLPELMPCAAIVGARSATAYGLEVARDLAADIAAGGATVVSGMARGIDAAAHEGALSVGRPTIAVLAGGVDIPYPAAHAGLYDRILATGAIVSDQPPGTVARRDQWPWRNRIIAALSRAVVIVQAKHYEDEKPRSGTLHTVNHAIACGRTVFAVPGDIRSALSTLPHHLIRSTDASICARAGDVLDEIDELKARAGGPDVRPLPDGLSDDEVAVMEAVSAGPARADDLAARAGLEAATLARVLTKLELKRLLARSPAGAFRRIH